MQGDQNKGGFHQRQRPAQATLSGHRKHHRKVDIPTAELVADLLPIGHPFSQNIKG
jgi:hypothetical protein